MNTLRRLIFLLIACAMGCAEQARSQAPVAPGNAGATQTAGTNQIVLIVRHAEKPEAGNGLSAEGERRAKAYASYFLNFQIDGKPAVIDYLYAARDSKKSHRPRLTLEPLAAALSKTIDCRFADEETGAIAKDIQQTRAGQTVLISWRHSEIPSLIQALGADPASLLPKGKWPDTQFGWVIELRFAAGKLARSRRVEENLVLSPAGAANPSPK